VCDTWSHVGRVFWFLLFGVAIILTHYSTTYILLITLGAAWLLRVLARGVRFAVRRRRSALSVDRRRAVAGLGVIGALVALAALWTGPLTHTSSQLEQTVSATVNELFGTGSASRSTDVAYGLFHSQVLTPDQELQQYRKQTIAQDDPTRLSPATVNRYAIKAVPQPAEKFTALGNRLDQAGVSPTTVNTVMRGFLADYYQVAAIAGLGVVAWRYRRKTGVTAGAREYLLLGLASFAGLIAVVVLPNLSVEYGLLRAFQQALLLLAPLAAEATIAGARLIAFRWAPKVAISFGVVAFASLIGFIPQVLGGYPPTLNLNNDGTYYNDYFLHTQEENGISWLVLHVGSGSAAVQSEIQTDRYTFFLINGTQARTSGDIFPTLIQRHSYVFVGYSTVTRDIASISVNGNTVSYRYPLALLNDHKNLVFASNGSRIYR
jgi:uncharacterized membrane protein